MLSLACITGKRRERQRKTKKKERKKREKSKSDSLKSPIQIDAQHIHKKNTWFYFKGGSLR